MGDEYGVASKQQIEDALTACQVKVRDYAPDPQLGGDYLVTIHAAEGGHERKITCIKEHLLAQEVSVTITYPGPGEVPVQEVAG